MFVNERPPLLALISYISMMILSLLASVIIIQTQQLALKLILGALLMLNLWATIHYDLVKSIANFIRRRGQERKYNTVYTREVKETRNSSLKQDTNMNKKGERKRHFQQEQDETKSISFLDLSQSIQKSTSRSLYSSFVSKIKQTTSKNLLKRYDFRLANLFCIKAPTLRESLIDTDRSMISSFHANHAAFTFKNETALPQNTVQLKQNYLVQLQQDKMKPISNYNNLRKKVIGVLETYQKEIKDTIQTVIKYMTANFNMCVRLNSHQLVFLEEVRSKSRNIFALEEALQMVETNRYCMDLVIEQYARTQIMMKELYEFHAKGRKYKKILGPKHAEFCIKANPSLIQMVYLLDYLIKKEKKEAHTPDISSIDFLPRERYYVMSIIFGHFNSLMHAPQLQMAFSYESSGFCLYLEQGWDGNSPHWNLLDPNHKVIYCEPGANNYLSLIVQYLRCCSQMSAFKNEHEMMKLSQWVLGTLIFQ